LKRATHAARGDKMRRCLKATVYLYTPTAEELQDNRIARYYATHQSGRVQLYDEEGRKIGNTMKAFTTHGELLHILAKQQHLMCKKKFAQSRNRDKSCSKK
jgi:hypothetical protein